MEADRCVLAADRGQVRVLTLNRPATRNAIDLELRVVLAEAIEGAMADDAVRVIVLTGAGGTFCSGGDITTMRRQGAAAIRTRTQAVQRVIRAIWHGGKPVLAAVEGYAIAAGPPLALAGIKAMLARWPADPDEVLKREVDLQARLMDTDDFEEGIAAFRERRKPAFRGR